MKHLAMAIVINDGKVLLKKRGCPAQGEIREFPGGAVKDNETGTDAAKRELQEISGIDADSHVATFSGINDFGGRIYYAIFNAEDQPLLSDKEAQFEWVKFKDLPLDDFYAADIDFINKHLSRYSKKETAAID
ncbi:NUDIX hydrolase [Vibrio salilacus]|uniref:NUDIX hydrolase n=1 Tax=Vibrio salilacus TaxID=1323749 RepID=UPI000C2A9E2C|nr:NUDIX hydrolase [Vibrio salilacus]